jgi:hypothetical protein
VICELSLSGIKYEKGSAKVGIPVSTQTVATGKSLAAGPTGCGARWILSFNGRSML